MVIAILYAYTYMYICVLASVCTYACLYVCEDNNYVSHEWLLCKSNHFLSL